MKRKVGDGQKGVDQNKNDSEVHQNREATSISISIGLELKLHLYTKMPKRHVEHPFQTTSYSIIFLSDALLILTKEAKRSRINCCSSG